MQTCYKYARSEVPVAVNMKITVIWDIKLCCLIMFTDYTSITSQKTEIFMPEIKYNNTSKILYSSSSRKLHAVWTCLFWNTAQKLGPWTENAVSRYWEEEMKLLWATSVHFTSLQQISLNMCFNIILPSIPKSHMWFLYLHFIFLVSRKSTK
jgi:hypothetical protein